MEYINPVNVYIKYEEQPEQWVSLAESLWEVKRQLKDLEKMEAFLLGELKAQSHDKDSKGGGFLFSSSVRKGSVDYGSIPELKTVNLEVYRKPDVSIWKLSKE